jgi:putative DNA primase/helicase
MSQAALAAPAARSTLDLALHLAGAGLPVFRLKGGENPEIAKQPFARGWQNEATSDRAKVTELFSAGSYGVGIFTGSPECPMVAVDVDRKPGKDGNVALLGLELQGFDLPPTRRHDTLTGGYHLLFKTKQLVAPGANVLGAGVDIRSGGSYVAASIGDRHYTIHDNPMVDAPEWVAARCGQPRERKSADVVAMPPVDQERAHTRAARYLANDAPLAVEGQGGDQTTYAVACRVRDYGVGEDAAAALMLDGWNDRCSPPWSDEDLRRKVRNAYAYGQEPPGHAAPEHDFAPLAVIEPAGEIAESSVMPLSEDGLALDFAETRQKDSRYIAKEHRWMRYDGRSWTPDETLSVYDAARRMLREQLRGHGADKAMATRLASAKAVAAVEQLARSDRRLVATTDQWDADPWLMNTPAGAVDLRSGTVGPHRLEHFATKMTAAAPGGACPIWRAFLTTITGGDAELQIFLQKLAGYCLTGSTQEHALFFLYGRGGNGKGVFLNTLTAVGGDYAKVAPVDTFTAAMGERHPADMAMLRGARLVTAQETEEGRQWAEAKVKALTGGDPITARFMRGDFFTYQPAFKLVIAGNHKPGLRNVDEAMRRRFHLIPFNVTIPAAERDVMLPEKLKAEWSGVLQWALEGCLLWQRNGLRPPAAVRDATDSYLAAEDATTAWLDEECVVDAKAWCKTTDLFDSWKRWSERTGERFVKRKQFMAQLEGKNFRQARHSSGDRGFAGVALKAMGEQKTPMTDPFN